MNAVRSPAGAASASSASHAPRAVEALPSPLPPALRWAGPLLATGFGAAVALRRCAYATGLKKPVRAVLPVLSVGNLTAGGTGKTPTVVFLTRGLIQRGLAKRPAVLTRGYGAPALGGQSDETAELAAALPGVPVIVNPDRVAGAAEAVTRGCLAAILDDGFQHWRLARDLDLVLLDATDPFGGGHLLPWGRLRENPAALVRAGAIVLTRCDLADPAGISSCAERLKALAPGVPVFRARHAPTRLRRLFDDAPFEEAGTLAGKRVLAACGLGNPQAFFETLRRLGARLTGQLPYPDHFDFRRAGLHELEEAARDFQAECIVVTEKDAVKLEALQEPAVELPPVWALGVSFELLEGADDFWGLVANALKRSPSVLAVVQSKIENRKSKRV